jgi:PAN domain
VCGDNTCQFDSICGSVISSVTADSSSTQQAASAEQCQLFCGLDVSCGAYSFTAAGVCTLYDGVVSGSWVFSSSAGGAAGYFEGGC